MTKKTGVLSYIEKHVNKSPANMRCFQSARLELEICDLFYHALLATKGLEKSEVNDIFDDKPKKNPKLLKLLGLKNMKQLDRFIAGDSTLTLEEISDVFVRLDKKIVLKMEKLSI